MTIERRVFNSEFEVEKRNDGEGEVLVLRGYGAVFNSESKDLGGFVEQIEPGAFDDVLSDDVRALFNHDPNLVLGRSGAGTLRINQDLKGLRYEVDLPDTQLARDLYTSIKRGDISQSSFAFIVEEDYFSEDLENNKFTRHITKVRSLIDVSPVTYPAYEEASVSARSFENWKESRNQEEAKPEEVEDYNLRIKELDLMVLDGPLTDESDDSSQNIESDNKNLNFNEES
jgi:hypothetical protein